MSKKKADDSLLENEEILTQGVNTTRAGDDPNMEDILADIDTSEIDDIEEDSVNISNKDILKEFDDLLNFAEQSEKNSSENKMDEEPDIEADSDFDFEDTAKNEDSDFNFEDTAKNEDSDTEIDDHIAARDEFDSEPTFVEKAIGLVKNNMLNTFLAAFSVVFITTLFWPQESVNSKTVYEDEFVNYDEWGASDTPVKLKETPIKGPDLSLAEKTADISEKTTPSSAQELKNAISSKKRSELVEPVKSLVKQKQPVLKESNIREGIEIQERSITPALATNKLENLQLATRQEPQKAFENSINQTSIGLPTTYDEYERSVADPKMVAKNQEAVFLILDKMKQRDVEVNEKLQENKELGREIRDALREIKGTIGRLKQDVDDQGKKIDLVTNEVVKLKKETKKPSVTATRSFKNNARNSSKVAYQIVSSRHGVAYVVSNRTGNLVRLEEGMRLIGYGKIYKILPNYVIKTENGLVKTKPRV